FRGEGKGAAFSDLVVYGDFLLDSSNLSVKDIRKGFPKKRYAAQFFATFSFSSEVASVWDALTAFLQAPMDRSKETMERWRDDGLSRIRRLKLALDGASDQAEATKAQIDKDKTNWREEGFEVEPRFLVVLHAVDLLFDKAAPKTTEIAPK